MDNIALFLHFRQLFYRSQCMLLVASGKLCERFQSREVCITCEQMITNLVSKATGVMTRGGNNTYIG